MSKEKNIYENQINMLLDKGIFIEDKKEVIDILCSLSYYTIIGYIPNFTDKNIDYKNKLNFNTIYKTYLFDKYNYIHIRDNRKYIKNKNSLCSFL